MDNSVHSISFFEDGGISLTIDQLHGDDTLRSFVMVLYYLIATDDDVLYDAIGSVEFDEVSDFFNSMSEGKELH